MPSYEVTIIGFTEGIATGSCDQTQATLGLIEIKPPVPFAENLSEIVLGKDKYNIAISEIATTRDSTFLLAEDFAPELDQNARQHRIRDIGFRLLSASSHPEEASEMMQENPFPNPS